MFSTKEQIAAFVGMFESGTRLTYKKGEYIIRPGEAPSGVFYIEKGMVKAFNITKYGEENLLHVRKSHEIFPLIWSVTGQGREVIYQALAPTVVRRVSMEDYNKELHNKPEIIPPFLDIVIEMYRLHSERILNLQFRTVRERLVSFLITMANRFGKKTEHGVLINVPLRHQDIASSINASRETTTRELAILERRGLITSNPPYITAKSIRALKSFF